MKRLLLAVLALAFVLTSGEAARAESGELCSEVAHVSWQADWDSVTVVSAMVDVPGCADGEPVGIQLLADGGVVPADGPVMAAVEDERAVFDLASLEQRVEPVTGVRVFLELHGEELVFFEVTVEQRFFNAPGNEQRGLRQVTTLQVPLGGSYFVPGAPSGYQDVACSEVNTTIDDDVIEQGSDQSFSPTKSGRHLACYQQAPGVPPGPPDAQEPEVLDEALERDDADGAPNGQVDGDLSGGTDPGGAVGVSPSGDVDVLGVSEERGSSASDTARLPFTGVNLWFLVALGAVLTLGGWRLLRSRERKSPAA